jgi:acyl dehydratase/NAD(P)-dependent dehydrogenase (short-subunit alcohol dehydrogenase family)
LGALASFRLGVLETAQLDRAVGRLGLNEAPGFLPLQLAVLGSSTIDRLSIRVAELRRRLLISVDSGAYGQCRQDLRDPNSSLHEFAPQAMLFSATARETLAAVPVAATVTEVDKTIAKPIALRARSARNVMREVFLASRIFSAADQERFAHCSGDVNPMHMDAIAARRTQAGVCVVHGVHLALWAMDVFAEVGKMPAPIGTLKVQFKNFVPVGSEVTLRVVRETETILHATVSFDGVAVMSLAIGSGSVAPAGALLSTTTASCHAPRLLSFSDIPGCAGWLPETADKEIAKLFPHAAKLLGVERVEAITRLSALVGMVCPGLYSIFTGFNLMMTAEADGITGLSFKVQNVDDRFRIADLAVVGRGIRGKVTALARPQPVAQPSLQSLVGKVAKDEFQGTTALIVGGSRGLGALTARIIAAGGGRVVITYVVGKVEAQEVAAEIGTQACSVLRYDVQEEPLAQLSGLEDDINQLYYFSTPHIAHQRQAIFTSQLFERFCQFYINGFHSLCAALQSRERKRLSVFYPSSVFVDDWPRGMLEYTMAKATGELLCAEMNRLAGGIRVVVRRLPRLLTDQTAAVMSSDNIDAFEILLPIVREMSAGNELRDSAVS